MAIVKLAEANLGGGFRLKIVESSKIDIFPEPEDFEIAEGDIELSSGASWTQWDFKPEVLNFKEDPVYNKGVPAYNASIDGVITKDRPGILTELAQYLGKRLVVILTSNNDISGARMKIVLGSKNEPAKLTIGKRDQGRNVIDINGIEFAFITQGRSKQTPFIID